MQIKERRDGLGMDWVWEARSSRSGSTSRLLSSNDGAGWLAGCRLAGRRRGAGGTNDDGAGGPADGRARAGRRTGKRVVGKERHHYDHKGSNQNRSRSRRERMNWKIRRDSSRDLNEKVFKFKS